MKVTVTFKNGAQRTYNNASVLKKIIDGEEYFAIEYEKNGSYFGMDFGTCDMPSIGIPVKNIKSLDVEERNSG